MESKKNSDIVRSASYLDISNVVEYRKMGLSSRPYFVSPIHVFDIFLNRCRFALAFFLCSSLAITSGCATSYQGVSAEKVRNAHQVRASSAAEPKIEYLIAPGDSLQVFVWRNPELSVTIPVRPDGRISLPLVDDIGASGKRPFDLAHDIEKELAYYIKEPKVTVIVTHFGGAYDQQVRVVGQATSPQALPFRKGMTLLDVMIAVGGLTEFAAGNRATVVRTIDGKRRQFSVRLSDLYNNGDIRANIDMAPGDILIIPESWF